MDLSSATHLLRVTTDPAITTARNSAARPTRRMSLVRRVSGCSKLPETVMSRPSTRIFQRSPGQRRSAQRLADTLTTFGSDESRLNPRRLLASVHDGVDGFPGAVEPRADPSRDLEHDQGIVGQYRRVVRRLRLHRVRVVLRESILR